MGLTSLPPEIKSMIVKLTPGRQELRAWHYTCKDIRAVLRQHRGELVRVFKRGERGEELDLTSPEVCTSSPEAFLAWMRVKSRTDAVILEQSHRLFYTFDWEREESQEEEIVRKRNARLVLRYIREHIGDKCFVKYFEASVQNGTIWAHDVVSALSKDNEMEGEEDDVADDEIDRDHEFALSLGRTALETLKSHKRQLREEDDGQPSIQRDINQWAIEHEGNLQKGNILAAARFSGSMLDYKLTQGAGDVQVWAEKYLHTYSNVFTWSVVWSVDEGEFAHSMLGIVERNPHCPHVQEWADHCYASYARFGMPLHAITFAQGMLEFSRANTPDLSSKWKQRCLHQQGRRALWKKAGDLAQFMLRAYLESGSLRESLPKWLQISQEIQLDKVASNSERPGFRLLRMAGPWDFELTFPVRLPRGLLTDMQAQARILESVTGATSDTKGTPIHGAAAIQKLHSAIQAWEAGKPAEYQNRTSPGPAHDG
jgi:hypothetical protein